MKPYLVITGGSGGIGAACIEYFSAQGFGVLNLSRRVVDIPGVDHLTFDLLSPNWDALDQVIDEAQLAERSLALVHCAAMGSGGALQAMTADALGKTFKANLQTPTLLTKRFIEIIQKPSSIIYVGSTLSEQAVPGAYPYIVSKHATVGMMRATCQDVFHLPIHTCCVCPGFTDTVMMHEHIQHDPQTLQRVKAMVGQNRLIEPAEIARLIYDCTQQSVINGSVIHANLGQRGQ